MKPEAQILRIAVLVSIVALMGWLIEVFEPGIYDLTKYHLADQSLTGALLLVGIITFFGFMRIGETTGGEWAIHRGGMRTAITVAIVTTYLVLLAYVAFFRPLGGVADQLPQITTNLLTSFTTIVGIVIPFYFGASAYVQGKALESSAVNDKRLESKTETKDSIK